LKISKSFFGYQKFFLALPVGFNLLSIFLLQILIVRIFGIGQITDSYALSMIFPTMLLVIASNVIEGVWLPSLSKNITKNYIESFSVSFGHIIFIAFVASIISLLLGRIFISYIFINLDEVTIKLSLELLSIFSLTIFFLIIGVSFQSSLRVKKKVIHNESIVSIFSVLTLSVVYVFREEILITQIAWILLAKSILIFLVYWFFCEPVMPKFRKNFFNDKKWKKSKPIVISQPFLQLNFLVDRFLIGLSGINGNLTLLKITETFAKAPIKFFEIIFSKPRISVMGQMIKENKINLIKKNIYKYFYSGLALTLSIVPISLILEENLLILIRSIFDLGIEDAQKLSKLFFIVLLYVFFTPLKQISYGIAFALDKTRNASIISLISFFLGLVIKVILFINFEIFGLVLGVSLTVLLETTLIVAYSVNILKN